MEKFQIRIRLLWTHVMLLEPVLKEEMLAVTPEVEPADTESSRNSAWSTCGYFCKYVGKLDNNLSLAATLMSQSW